MKSYEQKFFENLDVEIAEFREKTLNQPSIEIYSDATRIAFYEFMNDFLRWEKFTTAEYKTFLASDKDFIYNLWSIAMDFEDFNVGNPTDASCVVDIYVSDVQAHPVLDCIS